jgi:putative sigma-54 modulation protein
VEIKVNSRHGSVRPEVEEHIRAKSEKILTYFERVTQIEVVVDFEHDKAKVEILVDTEHRHDFVASDENDEASVAFDSALHKIEQQVRRYKDKVQNHRRDTPMGGPVE